MQLKKIYVFLYSIEVNKLLEVSEELHLSEVQW
jgi:hypothetical protein